MPSAALSEMLEHTWVGWVTRQEVGHLDASTLCCDCVASDGGLANKAGFNKVEVCKDPATSEHWHSGVCILCSV